ncbi:outer membrane protein [Beijerinckia sp. L45]|uniref:outer membrane protein n=1 Tax=Beijerinckia sp. L45 TaxID=1641855 RepID=UPI00131CA1B0|nr:outer membrane protein [Beijerinckia sp. L45]
MGSFKALCIAGIASLAAMSTAHAADLFLPPPPPVEPAYVPVEFSGAFYLRGDVGIGISDLRTRASTFDEFVPDVRYEQHNLDDSGFIDLGVGYKFNNYFRADVTGEYRTGAHFSAIESYNQGFFNTPQDGSRLNDTYNGSIRTIAGLVNGYVDLGTWYCLTPYIGAGVGVANVKVSSIVDQGQTGGFGYSQSKSQTNFAWALMTGVAFNVTPSTKIELGYRYLNMGNVSSNAIVCQDQGTCPNEVQHYKLASQDIKLGVRYSFDVAPPPPAQYPIVRKY